MNGSTTRPLLEMRGIGVSYDGIPALSDVDFDLYPGEIHALVGSHRAGKSSLVKLLSGAVRKERGEILFDGKRIEAFTPQSSMRSGIGIVYQHLNVIPSLNAAENVFAGRLPHTAAIALDTRAMHERAARLFQSLGFPIDVDVPVHRLSAAAQHIVELGRVLYNEPRILILDEISSKLTPEEMERVYPLLMRFRSENRSVIYISHNMDEVFQLADRVTILKEGRRTDTERVGELDRIKLIKLTYSSVLSREELGRQNVELFRLKRYNENIIKNIPVGVVILNDEQKIHLINYAAVKILGVTAEATGERFDALFTRDDLPDKDLVMEKIASRGELVLDEAAFRGDKTLKVSVYPFRDEDYLFLGTIVLIEDVSTDRYVNDYLLRAEKIASTAELAAGVAHEINDPLGIVKNYVELLKLKGLDGDTGVKLQKIENEITRIEKTVGSLLSFAKFDDVSFHAVDIVELVEEVVVLMEHRFAEKSVRVTQRLAEPGLLVPGDEHKLKQLFVNLLANGIEAVEAETGEIAIAVTSEAGGRSVEVSVTDNGCGIADEIRSRIFNPFFSTKKNKRNVGLGLSICQRIVELHNGMITCASETGRGTRFSVRFPRAETAALDG